MKTKHRHIILLTAVNSCRFLLAGVFIFSGFVKVIDPLGVQYKIEEYLTAFGLSAWSLAPIPLFTALALSVLEFVAGIFLLLGIRRITASVTALGLMTFMTLLSLYTYSTGAVADCGCFGDALKLSPGQTFFKNLLLLPAAYVVFRKRRLVFRFFTPATEWILSPYTIFFAVVLSLFCLRYLPLIDFRPYHIGVNIPNAMSIPPGKKPTVYETHFILEKDGKQATFSLDNYPDSTWTFVTSRTAVKEPGYEPPIQDFSITLLSSGEDITDEVLTHTGYSFLLIAHRIEEANDGNIDLINEIYDYSVDHGYPFYAITSSPDSLIAQWQEQTGAEYPFAYADDTTLKTIIRSNPGLVLLKNGTILNKWSEKQLPNEYQLSAPLDQLPLGKVHSVDNRQAIYMACAWYVLPLLLILAVDLLFIRRRRKAKDSPPLDKTSEVAPSTH